MMARLLLCLSVLLSLATMVLAGGVPASQREHEGEESRRLAGWKTTKDGLTIEDMFGIPFEVWETTGKYSFSFSVYMEGIPNGYALAHKDLKLLENTCRRNIRRVVNRLYPARRRRQRGLSGEGEVKDVNAFLQTIEMPGANGVTSVSDRKLLTAANIIACIGEGCNFCSDDDLDQRRLQLQEEEDGDDDDDRKNLRRLAKHPKGAATLILKHITKSNGRAIFKDVSCVGIIWGTGAREYTPGCEDAESPVFLFDEENDKKINSVPAPAETEGDDDDDDDDDDDEDEIEEEPLNVVTDMYDYKQPPSLPLSAVEDNDDDDGDDYIGDEEEEPLKVETDLYDYKPSPSLPLSAVEDDDDNDDDENEDYNIANEEEVEVEVEEEPLRVETDLYDYEQPPLLVLGGDELTEGTELDGMNGSVERYPEYEVEIDTAAWKDSKGELWMSRQEEKDWEEKECHDDHQAIDDSVKEEGKVQKRQYPLWDADKRNVARNLYGE